MDNASEYRASIKLSQGFQISLYVSSCFLRTYVGNILLLRSQKRYAASFLRILRRISEIEKKARIKQTTIVLLI